MEQNYSSGDSRLEQSIERYMQQQMTRVYTDDITMCQELKL